MLHLTAIDPVALFTEAIRLALAHRIAYARVAALPFAACLTLLLWAGFRDGAPLVGLVAFAFSLLITVPVATAWHRFLILGHGRDRDWLQLRFGAAEWRYLLTWMKIALISAALAFPLALQAVPPGGSPLPVILAGLIAGFAPIPFLLAVPAAAIGESARLRDAEMISRGHRLRLLGLAALLTAASLPLETIGALATVAAGPGVIALMISELAAYALLPVWTAALSLAYLKLSPFAAPDGVPWDG